jgi:hypothetical protein
MLLNVKDTTSEGNLEEYSLPLFPKIQKISPIYLLFFVSSENPADLNMHTEVSQGTNIAQQRAQQIKFLFNSLIVFLTIQPSN